MFDFEGISIRILVFTLSQTFEANAVRRCVVSGWKQCCDGTSLVCGAETYRLVQGGKKDSYAWYSDEKLPCVVIFNLTCLAQAYIQQNPVS